MEKWFHVRGAGSEASGQVSCELGVKASCNDSAIDVAESYLENPVSVLSSPGASWNPKTEREALGIPIDMRWNVQVMEESLQVLFGRYFGDHVRILSIATQPHEAV